MTSESMHGTRRSISNNHAIVIMLTVVTSDEGRLAIGGLRQEASW